MGGRLLGRGALSTTARIDPPARSSRDHSLAAGAARVLRLDASPAAHLWNKLLGLYSLRGAPDVARRLFDGMPQRDSVSYNTLIARVCRSAPEGARAYSRMLREDGCGGARPDGRTLSALLALPLSPGGDAAGRGFVRQVHSHAVRLGLCSSAFVGTALVRAYGRCRDTGAIAGVFKEIAEPDVVCWNVVIDACTQTGSVSRAAEVMSRMRMAGYSADGFTLTSILKGCSREEDLGLGMQLHARLWKVGFDSETASCNALISMYLKCRAGMSSAVQVFDGISEPDITTWTAMIAGLVQNGLGVEAVSFYKEMVRAGEKENGYSFASVLSACCAIARLQHGKMVHCRIFKSGFCMDTIVGNTLLDMYFKCGSSMDAQLVFNTMCSYDVVSWTAMIVGYGRHNDAGRALESFRTMIDRGFKPDNITFLTILSACSQGGLVDEGLKIFHSMVEFYNVKPQREHYACLVDLLGHAGRLNEAETLIRQMGLELDSFAWESLLSACGLHGEVDLGKKSAGKVMELEPQKHGPYVLLSNMYAEQCRWHDKEMLRERLNCSNIRKGASWSCFPASEAN
ncbi:pentatricopeptide repeat-containing protein At2g22070-like [Oryza brachyantha]|nr:pentatricopeptide repeat-containing protein At2g22070-like [Oryza brachyantha]